MTGWLVRQHIAEVETADATVYGINKRIARTTMKAQATILMDREFVRTRADTSESERPGRPVANGREDSIAV
jgi:hypothetical protein